MPALGNVVSLYIFAAPMDPMTVLFGAAIPGVVKGKNFMRDLVKAPLVLGRTEIKQRWTGDFGGKAASSRQPRNQQTPERNDCQKSAHSESLSVMQPLTNWLGVY